MVKYFIMRLEDKKINYNRVVKKYPQYKDEIDSILSADGYAVNEDGIAVKVG